MTHDEAVKVLERLESEAFWAVEGVKGSWQGWYEAEEALDALDRFLDEGPIDLCDEQREAQASLDEMRATVEKQWAAYTKLTRASGCR
jgi:hypothetical protein